MRKLGTYLNVREVKLSDISHCKSKEKSRISSNKIFFRIKEIKNKTDAYADIIPLDVQT
jgi:hypothetical protein